MTRHADGSAARRTRLAPRRTGSITERLAYLFDVVHAPGTRAYTAAEVARGVRAAGGRRERGVASHVPWWQWPSRLPFHWRVKVRLRTRSSRRCRLRICRW